MRIASLIGVAAAITVLAALAVDDPGSGGAIGPNAISAPGVELSGLKPCP